MIRDYKISYTELMDENDCPIGTSAIAVADPEFSWGSDNSQSEIINVLPKTG